MSRYALYVSSFKEPVSPAVCRFESCFDALARARTLVADGLTAGRYVTVLDTEEGVRCIVSRPGARKERRR